MGMFDLIDIQRKRYPNTNKFSYTSKALNVKSRIDFFLVLKELKKYVKTVDIQASIAPDHKTVYMSLDLPKNTSRGPGF